MNDLIPQWDSGVQHMVDTFAGNGGLVPSCVDALGELKDAMDGYDQSLKDLQVAADVSFGSVLNGYDRNLEKLQQLLASNDGLITQYMNQINAIQLVMSQVDTLIGRYGSLKQAAEDAATAAYEMWMRQQEMIQQAVDNAAKAQAEATQAAQQAAAAQENSSSTSKSTSSSNKSGGSNGSNGGSGGTKKVDDDGDNPKKSTGTPGALSTHPNPTVNPNGEGGSWSGGTTSDYYEWLKKQKKQTTAKGSANKINPQVFASGGYTGDWTNDVNSGRLAILHEKELVLNQEDTEKILSAVNIVRDIDTLISNINQSAFNRMSNVSYAAPAPISLTPSNVVDQQVSIQANFPGVRDAREIEQALNNLVNVASQHAFNNLR